MSTISPKVTVIIPVYNAKPYLQRCLDSVLKQTHQNVEVLAVNDGSRDGSRRILERNAIADSRLRIIDQPNQGQGVARNRALDEATGEYILFVDADDWIEPLTLELCLARAERDRSDFVHFDWKLASRIPHRPKAFNYFNIRNIWKRDVLDGDECDELMDTVSFFTVTSLYRRDFLDRHSIRYGEGYVYEDIPFYALAANFATRVSLVHSPLYIIQPNMSSTTQTAVDTDRHAVGHLAATNATLERLVPRTDATLTYFFKYSLQKFMEYYSRRVPEQYREAYARGFVDAFSTVELVLDPSIPVNRYAKLFVRTQAFPRRRYGFFQSVISTWLSGVLPLKQRVNRRKSAARERAKKRLRAQNRRVAARARRKEASQPLAPAGEGMLQLDGAIVFLGFDHRFTGNSRYLFEQMLADSRFMDHPLLFITDDERVADEHRIDPEDRTTLHRALASAAIVIAESWVPLHYRKAPGAIWLQLWHGTPLKRVLFDSNETSIIQAKNDHKVMKHRDIQKWDFLLSDSPFATTKFASAFLFPPDRIVQGGYPRVRYLLENRNNAALRAAIKQQIGVPEDKKVVLYAPTWRDYNYARPADEHDLAYALPAREFLAEMGDDYVLVFHDHNYMTQGEQDSSGTVIDASGHEIQELLLVADSVVSDYSSIVFDCFATEKPVALYCTDEAQFEAARGVYPDFWAAVAPLVAASVSAAASVLKDPPETGTGQALIKSTAYSPDVDLLTFIEELDLHHLHRNW